MSNSKLKRLVNDQQMWEALKEELEDRIKRTDAVLRQAIDPHIVYRQQGAILALEALLRLRDEVNGTR